MPDANHSTSPSRSIEVFCSYSHKDEALRDELEAHVSVLKRTGIISVWHDRRISPGMEWDDEIFTHLNRADLILLLVSSDFINSDYCHDKEVTRAMARHQLGEARVVPVILRDCIWDLTMFSKLQALPRDGKAVSAWGSRDEALKNVAVGIRKVAEELGRAPAKTWKEREAVKVKSPKPAPERGRHSSPIKSARDLLLYGPRIKISFGPPILNATSTSPRRPEPSGFLQTDALLDIGAARTILTPDAVRRAGLTKIDQTQMLTLGGLLTADVYAASIQFPSGLSPIETMAIVCCELRYPLFHCLLGRDVLSRWILNYDGPAGTWEVRERNSEPSVEPPEAGDPRFWGKMK